jgi:hypothetical protein
MSTRKDMTAWSAQDDAALRAAYAAGGIRGAMAALPARTRSATINRARKLRLERRRVWTDAEDARLRKLWNGETPLGTIAAALKRTEHAVYCRARELGLQLGCPERWERMAAAAQRAGYSVKMLGKILRANNVRPLPTISPRSDGRPVREYIVWPQDVDDAVAAWLDAEPLTTAARREGVCPKTLARRLEAADVSKQVRRGKHWRVSAADVELALGRTG